MSQQAVVIGLLKPIEDSDEMYDTISDILAEHFCSEDVEVDDTIEITTTDFNYKYQLREFFETLAEYVSGELVVVNHPNEINRLNIIATFNAGKVKVTNYVSEDTVSSSTFEGGKW